MLLNKGVTPVSVNLAGVLNALEGISDKDFKTSATEAGLFLGSTAISLLSQLDRPECRYLLYFLINGIPAKCFSFASLKLSPPNGCTPAKHK